MLLDQRHVGGEAAEVGTRAEHLLAGPGQHDGAHVAVVSSALEGVDELREQLRRERVSLLGAVQGDGRHPGIDFVEELLVVHRRGPAGPYGIGGPA